MKTIIALAVCGVVGIAVGHGRTGYVRSGGWHQSQQETQKPTEAQGKAEQKPAAKTNPVKVTEESLALGKRLYGTDCAICHGKEGAGDGDLAVELKLQLKDLRDPAVKEMTDEEIYKIILKGKKQPMPGEEERFDERDIWIVVNYVRSLGKGKT